MKNVFHPAMNTISRVTIFGALFVVAAGLMVLYILARTPYATGVGVIREQPVPFSHQHHVSDVGIDCRYCHRSVEHSAHAGIPAIGICMNCHSHLFNDQPMLRPVRQAYVEGQPLAWTRVHDMADYVQFNHQIHLHKGIGCVSCHGNVDEMPLMWKNHSLLMEWCLQCHENPLPHLRPREFVFRLESLEELRETPEFQDYLQREHPRLVGKDLSLLRAELAERYGVVEETDCSNCHY